MSESVNLPRLATEFANVKGRLDRLERRLDLLGNVSTGGNDEAVFFFPGVIASPVWSPGYLRRKVGSIIEIVILCRVPDPAYPVVVTIYKNGASFGFLTMSGDLERQRNPFVLEYIPNQDVLSVQLGMSSAAEDVTVICRFDS